MLEFPTIYLQLQYFCLGIVNVLIFKPQTKPLLSLFFRLIPSTRDHSLLINAVVNNKLPSTQIHWSSIAMADEADTWAPPIMPPDAPGEGRTPYLFIDKFPAADILLNAEDASVDTFTMFDCYQEALDWRSNLAQREHRVDHTIPRSVHQKKAMVKLLFIAFKSIACANDNEPMIAPFREHKHDNGRVEVLCWMLLVSLSGWISHSESLG